MPMKKRKNYEEMSLERLRKEKHRNEINILYAKRRGDKVALENLERKRQDIKNYIEEKERNDF